MKRNLYIILCLCLFVPNYAQSLNTLISEALANNPNLERLNYSYKIAQEKVNEINTLPNTTFTAGYMALKPEMDMPMTRFSISAMQMLPWFGTIKTKQNYASSVADTKKVDITIAQKKLALNIADIYFELYGITATQDVLKENVILLETFEELALSSVKIGKASTVDVLRLQIQQNELEQERKVLEERSEGLRIALNSLMNRDLNAPIIIDPTLSFPEIIQELDLNKLSNNPELLKFDKIKANIEQSELVNQIESKPTIGIGVEYMNQTDSPMVTSSFKDMLMPMVTVSIPIFNHKFESVTLQNELRQQEILSRHKELLNTLTSRLATAISNMKQARIKYNTQQENLNIAKNAEKILLKNYETNTIDYDEVLKIQALQLKFQKKQVEAIKTYYKQSAIIDYLTKN